MMNGFFELTKRNIRIYLRDRGAVFFSLMSMFIVIMLMVFFLGDMNIEAITDILGMFPGRDAEADRANAELLVLSWTCAGIISINAVTVTLASLSSMIKDRESGRLGSIYTAPLSRIVIAAGYVAAAWVSSVVVCSITLAVTEIYCVASGMEMFTFAEHMKLIGMIMANSFTYASLMYLAAFAAKTAGAWSGLGTVIGTLVGFLGGIYLPVGSLADGIVSVMKCTPILYGTVIFRSVMTDTIAEKTFDGAPAEVLEEYRSAMGITLESMGMEVTQIGGTILLVICGAVFLLMGALAAKYSKRTDR